ncbi:hypothetical protein KP509_32G028500 [Ceratopteris richardii]|nr:hypothetical protein KP509_32G028500 [Ceratopteris richardii]
MIQYANQQGLQLDFPKSFTSSRISCHISESRVQAPSDPFSKKYRCIEVSAVEQGTVGLISLNRPDVLNALSEDLMHDLIDALQGLDASQEIGAIVLTGKGKAFAAGADIKELKDKDIVSIFMSPFPSKWNDIMKIKKPIIAAVNGYALGGGCEVALMCDIILAGEKAVFGQPELKLGTIPGMGGTQRLIREVGKSRAMEMILTGSYFLDAQEACQRGLASRVVAGSNADLINEAISVAGKIAKQSRPAVIIAKAAVNSAYETSLQEGLKQEKALFGATFALADRKEGMSAFIEKREPQFVHK